MAENVAQFAKLRAKCWQKVGDKKLGIFVETNWVDVLE
jgi:hypothetical protein